VLHPPAGVARPRSAACPDLTTALATGPAACMALVGACLGRRMRPLQWQTHRAFLPCQPLAQCIPLIRN
jgi:hypothetical protein